MKDSNNRPDAVVAAEFWEGLKQRDDSIFVDLFYGQLKSRVSCSICGYVSITFDPYSVMSLPVPRQQTSQSTMQIRFYPINFNKPVIEVTIALQNKERTTVGEIKEKVRQSVHHQAVAEGENVTLDDVQMPIICIVKDLKIEMMAKSDFEIGNLSSGFKLVALEREDHDKDTSKLVPLQLMITQQKSSYMIFRQQQPIT